MYLQNPDEVNRQQSGEIHETLIVIVQYITYKENYQQNSNHPISKYDIKRDSNTNAEHEHWLDENGQVVVNNGHVKCRMPELEIVVNS